MASQSDTPHVVIVGAGFGGLEVARRLAEARVRLTIIDHNNHHLFQPLLYQVATADLSPANVSAPIRSIVRHQRHTDVLLAEVTGIDVAAREVLATDGATGEPLRVGYDTLVLATGAQQSYFGHDDWESLAPGLKSLTDATAIRRKILLAFEAAEMEQSEEDRRAWLTFIIVGGGPTGVEMAGAVAQLAHKTIISDFRHFDPASARVLLVEAGSRILPAFPEDLSASARRQLEAIGAEVLTGAPVQEVRADGAIIAGQFVPAHTIIWSAGVQASPAGVWLGTKMDRAGRVLVTPQLTVPEHDEIFVIGDTAHVEHDGKLLPGVAPVAMQQGHYVAKVIRARLRDAAEPAPFVYRDKGNLATIGRSHAIADLGRMHLSGFPAWAAWLAIHITYLIDFRNRLLVLIQWAWAYFTYQRGARLILPEEPSPPVMQPRIPLAVPDSEKTGG
jgi:NADH dehydrogenase